MMKLILTACLLLFLIGTALADEGDDSPAFGGDSTFGGPAFGGGAFGGQVFSDDEGGRAAQVPGDQEPSE